jgi:hypothetical protein
MAAMLCEGEGQSGCGGENEESRAAHEHTITGDTIPADTAALARRASVIRAFGSCCAPRHGRSSFFSFSFSTQEHFS